jgi:hypothetical protein
VSHSRANGLESLKLRDASLVFFLLLLGARIDVVGEQSPRFVSLLASTLERHFRKHVERENLFRRSALPISPTAEAILQPPPFVPVLTDEQVQPFLIKELPILLAGLRVFRPEYSSAAVGYSTLIRN